MATCYGCGGHSFNENECRDCGREQEGDSKLNIRHKEIDKSPVSRETAMGSRLHPENNLTNYGESPQQEFPFLKRK